MAWTEWVGYAGSALIAVSLMMGNIWRLRWINLYGAAVFATYGLLVHAYPVVALNGFIVLINAYYLVQMARQRDYFSLLELPEASELRDRFLDFYRADIAQIFPGFEWQKLRQPKSVFVLRNLLPVGLFVYQELPDGTREIFLDYVVPQYRDLHNARFLFGATAGKAFVTRCTHAGHQRYLRHVGFRPDPADPTLFRKAG